LTILGQTSLRALKLPLSITQQLAELRYLQGNYDNESAISADLLAGMAVKSRLNAIKSMSPTMSLFNYQLAFDSLESSIEAPALTAELIQSLHQKLNPQGGRWRSIKLTLDRRDQSGKQLVIPATKEQINRDIQQLLADLKIAFSEGLEPLLAIPLFSLELMKTFPFFDGNRRILLLLTRHLLEIHGYNVVKYIDLEPEFLATERAFYRALNESDRDNPSLWLSYWWVLIKRLYQRFNRQIQHANIKPGRGSKTVLIERFVKQQQQPFQFSDVCKAFPTISRDHIKMILRRLKEQHIIETKGHGRGASWHKL
jgi:Fic family protein